MVRRLLVLLLTVVLLLGLISCTSAPEGTADVDVQEANWIIGTATTGGTYYPIGVGLASLWTEKLKDEGIRVSAISSAGSGENIAMMRDHEIELSILQGLFGRSVYKGIEIYEGQPPFEELRSMCMLWPNVEHFVMLKKSAPTGNVLDIVGSRFVIGRPGSGTEQSGLQLLKGVGIDPEDVDFEYVGYFEAIDLMRDGRVDGANVCGGAPVGGVTEAYASIGGDKLTLLEWTDQQVAETNEKSAYPGFRYVLPAGTYPGQTELINTIAQPNWLGVHSNCPEEIVYKLTKTIYDNLEYLYDVHDIAKAMTLETALDGLPVPLHPGAYKYFLEEGFDIPDDLVPPGL